MFILGINSKSHDTSAALVHDGKLIFAIEEERLNKEKHTRAFPINAVRECLKFANISIDEIDVIATPQIISRLVQARYLDHWHAYFPRVQERMTAEMGTVKDLLRTEDEIREKLHFKKEIFSCRHHISHMASAYYGSGFEESALLSVDGLGEIESMVMGEARGSKINVFDDASTYWPSSLGSLYAAATLYLGFDAHCDEGKVMGLASYGDPKTYHDIFQEIVKLRDNGRFEFDLSYLAYPFRYRNHFTEEFIARCGAARTPKTDILKRHEDFAASVQQVTEETMLHAARHLYEVTQQKNLCLAGGVALNCVANGRILREMPFKNIVVQPAANDAGTALGAALYCYYFKHPEGGRHPLSHSYLGTGFSDQEVERMLRWRKISFIKNNNVFEEAAKLLAEGNILAWFNGRMEFGPRSLGNRSILTAPYPAEMKDILNARVKRREHFRPFAPSVREGDCGEYFDSAHASPYMLLTYNVLPDMIQKIPAITHVDGTARVQTVREDQNHDFYRLITEFKKRTGVGVLLNTSFNVMGEPIVQSPEDALSCFLGTQIDYLIFNAKYIIKKE